MNESRTIVTGGQGNSAPAATLLERFRAGDADAVRQVEVCARQFVNRNYYNALKHLTDQIVQDTVDEVLEAVMKQDFLLRTTLQSLVRRIALCNCIDEMRKRRPTVSLEDVTLESPGRSPYVELLDRDERARLRWAIVNLDLPCQMIIREHWFEGRTYPEIAVIYGKKAGTWAWWMYKCMRKLTTAMLAGMREPGEKCPGNDQRDND